MDKQLEDFKLKWVESTRIGLEGDTWLGREKYAREVLNSPIPDQSTALYAERDRIRDACRGLAEAYVDANKAACEARFGHLSLTQLVADVSHYRANEREEDQWATEAWLLATFEPQNIGGTGAIVLKRQGR